MLYCSFIQSFVQFLCLIHTICFYYHYYYFSLEIYFDKKSPDFGMLMDLLAECNGITDSFR